MLVPSISNITYAAPNQTEQTEELDEAQKNSISMLNYLAALTQEVNSSNDSRMYLENVYSSLISNTYPNAVDKQTQTQITSLLDTIEGYRMVNVKRERLQYVYDQNKAQALRAALPNATGLLSTVASLNWIKLATSVAYMAVDSVTSYNSYNSQLDMKYLQDQWDLDDEESEVLHTIRKEAFTYMLNIVRDYNLPGDLALSEEAINEFVKAENNNNIVSRIQFLESNKKTYKAFGYYWIVLAKSYFENGDYADCISAIDTFEETQSRIFRKDYEYATVLPLGIAAAKETLSGKQYIEQVDHYANALAENISNTDWSSRYFLSQTYVDLYSKTKDEKYLDKAYEEIKNNVNYLKDEQKNLNNHYLSKVVEEKIPDKATKVQKEDIKSYNKLLKESRKTELPPVYEPLLINCDLLFNLAEQKKISDSEKKKIEGILRGDGTALFLNDALENK